MTTISPSRLALPQLPSIPNEINVVHGPYDAPVQRWRFRNHLPERRRWLNVLKQLIPDTRLFDRFHGCGSGALVVRNDETGEYRVRGTACKVRVCPACRPGIRARVYERIFREFEQSSPRDLKFITLTMLHSGAPLAEQLLNLRMAFRRLRSKALWKRHVSGGFAVVELGFSENDNCWHPHLHIICRSTFIPHHALRTAWLAVTKNSMIVDIRPVKSKARAIEYVCKYVAKLPEPGTLDRPDYRFAELFIALYNGHLLISFGRVRPNEPRTTLDGESGDVWKSVCKLSELLAEARNGTRSAWDILAKLTPLDPQWLADNILVPRPTSHSPPGDPLPCRP